MSEINAILPILSGMKQEMKKMADLMAQMNKTHAQHLTEEWVTKVQAMEILKVSARTLENLKSSGQLSYTKINGLLYFNTTDIEHLFQRNYVSNTTLTGNPSFFNCKNNVSTSE